MAQRHPSALRQHRRSERAAERNQRNLARLRTSLKKIRSLIADKNATESAATLQSTISLIDRSVARRAIHRNTASRLKGRLMRQVRTLGS